MKACVTVELNVSPSEAVYVYVQCVHSGHMERSTQDGPCNTTHYIRPHKARLGLPVLCTNCLKPYNIIPTFCKGIMYDETNKKQLQCTVRFPA